MRPARELAAFRFEDDAPVSRATPARARLCPRNLPPYCLGPEVRKRTVLFKKKKKKFYLFLERGEGREGNITVWLPLVRPLLGTWPEIQDVP